MIYVTLHLFHLPIKLQALTAVMNRRIRKKAWGEIGRSKRKGEGKRQGGEEGGKREEGRGRGRMLPKLLLLDPPAYANNAPVYSTNCAS